MPKRDNEVCKALWVYFDKPERMRALYKLRKEMPVETFIKTFGDVWVNLESHYQDMPVIEKIMAFIKLRPEEIRKIIMDGGERDAWRKIAISSEITIYRGCWSRNMHGWSWTLDKKIAEKFAKAHAPDGYPIMMEGKAKLQHIIAYFNRRDEEEIVIRPENVQEKAITKLDHQKPRMHALIYHAVQAGRFFSPEHQKEVAIMQASHDPESYLGFAADRMNFFKKYGFSKQYRFLEEVTEVIKTGLKEKHA